MFNRLFTGKSGKRFFGRVIEQNNAFQSQIFNEQNEMVFISQQAEQAEQADKKMTFFFGTIKNDF
jgi:hypothetical protein